MGVRNSRTYVQNGNTPSPARTRARTLATVVLWTVGVTVVGAAALGLYGAVCGGIYGAVHGDLWKAITWGGEGAVAGAVVGLVVGVMLGFTEADAARVLDWQPKKRSRPPEAIPAALAARSRLLGLNREAAPELKRINPEPN